jgi:hypothetical protein
VLSTCSTGGPWVVAEAAGHVGVKVTRCWERRCDRPATKMMRRDSFAHQPLVTGKVLHPCVVNHRRSAAGDRLAVHVAEDVIKSSVVLDTRVRRQSAGLLRTTPVRVVFEAAEVAVFVALR